MCPVPTVSADLSPAAATEVTVTTAGRLSYMKLCLFSPCPKKTHPNISPASSEGALEAAKTQSPPHALFTSSQLGKLELETGRKKNCYSHLFFLPQKLPAGNTKLELFIYIFHICGFCEIDETTAAEWVDVGKNIWSCFFRIAGKRHGSLVFWRREQLLVLTQDFYVNSMLSVSFVVLYMCACDAVLIPPADTTSDPQLGPLSIWHVADDGTICRVCANSAGLCIRDNHDK